MNTSTIIDRYCSAWSHPSATHRAETLSTVWADGATYTDPTVHARGAQALLSHIEGVQAFRPGAKVVRSTPVDEHHGVARFGFRAIAADGAVLREGLDIAFMAPDGTRIDRIIGFFGALARAPVEPSRSIGVDASSLIDRYCEAWSEPSEHRRAELLASVWGAHTTYTDPFVHAGNAEELLSHITRTRARYPGAKVVRTSRVDIHHGTARFAWHLVRADGAALPESLDIAFVSSDNTRIERMIGFFGPLAASGQ